MMVEADAASEERVLGHENAALACGPEQTVAAESQPLEIGVDGTKSSAGNAPEKLKHLVVDAGALIRLEQLHSLADEFWTVREVVTEIRDKKARDALKLLPFELKIKEPTEEAMAAVVAFSKKTGDMSVMSTPDIKIIALTYMLHKEMHGLGGILTEPAKYSRKQGEGSDDDDEDDHEGQGQGIEADVIEEKPKIDVATLGVKKPGVSWAAALGGESAPINAPEQPPVTSVQAESMWDDDDFAGAPAASNPSWPSLADASKVPDMSLEHSDEPKAEWPSLSQVAATEAAEKDRFLKKKEEIEQEVKETIEQVNKKREKMERKKQKQRQALENMKALDEALDDKEEVEEEAQVPSATRSRIIGASGVHVDSAVLEGDDWITSENLDSVDPFQSLKGLNSGARKPVTQPKKQIEVACVTTDYAMQNVMLQMQLRMVTLEGRAVTTVRRFVLKCDSCASMCRQLDKKFCPACGNPTLARLSYSISPNGVLRYHYKKGRKVSTRGKRFSLPKPTGGRLGDLLLTEDQLLTGWWGQKARAKNNATSMFGEHVTESLGLNLTKKGDGIRIGYGRQNPNAAKGRERRGKKKKRSSKKPGHL